MKLLKMVILVPLLALSVTLKAQDKVKVLPPEAFNRMIVQDITHAITGESTPVTGIKVDVSKPEATISGMFPLKSKRWFAPDIISFDLKGGVTDKTFSFFKGSGSAGSAYEFKPSIHFFPAWSSAFFGKPPKNIPAKTYTISKNNLVVAEKNRVLDTIYTITFLYNHYLKNVKIYNPYPRDYSPVDSVIDSIAANLIPKVLNQPGLKLPGGLDRANILSYLPQTDTDGDNLLKPGTYYEKLIILFNKYEKRYDNLDDEYLDKQIANASDLWTKKQYYWFTVSPILRSDKVNEYQTKFKGRDSLYFKSGFRWSYGVSASMNFYSVWPKSWAILIRPSFSLMKTNNMNNLTPYNYETRTSFFQYNTAITQKIRANSAYNNFDIIEGTEKQLSCELYILPIKSLFPGGFISANISNSRLFKLATTKDRQDDDFKAGLEFGFVFNINNKEKDKTFLSILPYFRYDDLTDKLRTSTTTGLEETRKDFQDRNMSMGIKVGIPITLPKKTS
ncbi:MAG: hypothetical protein V4687_04470 [Bacteroidota bacterium]